VIIKRNVVIALAAVVVVAVVVIASSLLLMNQGSNNKNYELSVGDFVKYHIDSNNSEIGQNTTFEIMGINSTTIFQKQTNEQNGTIEWVGYNNITRNQTVFEFAVDHPPAGVSVTHIGTESLQLRWGMRSTERYHIVTSDMTYDVWLRSGILAKYQFEGSFSETITLIDSNMPQFTG
jgi:hypothetical protein